MLLKIVFLVMTFAGIVLYEAPQMIRNQLWKELWVFSGILMVGFAIAVMLIIGIAFPIPTLPD